MANTNIQPNTCRFQEGAAPSANQRLGLHVTSDELAIWQDRMVNGPYKTSGDVSTNSPGDWTKISNNASSFLSNPSAQRWAGYTGAGCVPNGGSLGAVLPAGERLRDAAFYYLITGNTSYRNAAITELVAQAQVAGVDFGNS